MENPHTKSINIPFMGFPPSFMYNIKYGIDQIKVGRYICLICLIIKSFGTFGTFAEKISTNG